MKNNNERFDELNKIIKNKKIKYCYIKKGGWYYRENYSGYTEYTYFAGVYLKEDAVNCAMKCDELVAIPINLKEHNKYLIEIIAQIEKNLLHN